MASHGYSKKTVSKSPMSLRSQLGDEALEKSGLAGSGDAEQSRLGGERQLPLAQLWVPLTRMVRLSLSPQ